MVRCIACKRVIPTKLHKIFAGVIIALGIFGATWGVMSLTAVILYCMERFC